MHPTLRALALALLASAWFPAPVLAQAGSFGAATGGPHDYVVGTNPQVVAVADLNGDGIGDLAVSNAGSNTVSVLLGNGNGLFQVPLDFSTGSKPCSVLAADLDRDGRPDLVTTNYSDPTGTVSVLRGNGDGTFQAPVNYPVGGITPNFAVAGDFNADGALDVAVAVFGANDFNARTVSVLLNNGNGTLAPPVLLTAQRAPLWVAAADLDGDAILDLVSANYGADTLSVFLGNGDGTFQLARNFAAGSYPASVAVGDFNEDGIPDIAVADYGSGSGNVVAVLLGTGGGNFAAPSFNNVGFGPVAVEVSDLNADGNQDLAVANWCAAPGDCDSGTTLSVLFGNGDGTFQPSQAVTAGRGVVHVVASDLDGDGLLDLVAPNYAASTVSVLINTSGPPSNHTLSVAKTGDGSGTVTSSPSGIACGSTCSAPYPNGTVVTLTAAATGGSTFTGWSGGGCSGTGPCVVTLSADVAVIASFSPPTPQFTLSVGTTGGGSGTVTSSPAGINCGASCSAGYTNGTLVTLTASPAGGSTFTGWSGACSGTGVCSVTMTAARSVTASFGVAGISAPILKWQYGGCLTGPYCDTGWYSSPAVADLDGDGGPEVVAGAYDVVALNGSNGSLKWRAAGGNRVWPGIGLADLTGDGTLEVVVGRGTDQLTAYNRTGGVLWSRQPFGSGEIRSLALADLENDGQVEIIVGSTSSGATRAMNVYEPNGSVRAGWPAPQAGRPGFGGSQYNQNIAVADMNGDGFKEIFGASGGHYITGLDRSGTQLAASAVYNGITPTGAKVWNQVGLHVDNAADLRGFANCGVEHRPNLADSAPAIADVNGDGVPELVVVGNIYDCDTGASLYQMPFILTLDRTRWSGSGFDWTVIPTPGSGSAPRSEDWEVIETVAPNTVVADLDGDGRKEILYPSYDGKLHAYWLDKTEHGSWPYTVPATGASGDTFRFASEPIVADLDGDGHAEVIFTSWPKKATGRVGQLHVLDYLGRELHRINLPAAAIDASWNGALAAPTLANIDADPDLEVVINTVSSGVVAYTLPNSANAQVLWRTGRANYRRSGSP